MVFRATQRPRRSPDLIIFSQHVGPFGVQSANEASRESFVSRGSNFSEYGRRYWNMNRLSSSFADKFAVSPSYAYSVRSKARQMNIYLGNGPPRLPCRDGLLHRPPHLFAALEQNDFVQSETNVFCERRSSVSMAPTFQGLYRRCAPSIVCRCRLGCGSAASSSSASDGASPPLIPHLHVTSSREVGHPDVSRQ